MKRINNRKFRLAYTLKTSDIGQKPQTYHRRIKSRLIDLIKASSASEFYIKAIYAPGLHNDGEYTNKKDAIFALNVFTEKPLLDDIGKW